MRQKGFSLMSGLTVRTSSRMKRYLHTKPFQVNWETTTLFIKTLRIIRTWDQVDLMSNKHWRNFKSRQYQHLDGIFTNISRRFGRKMEWLHLKIFRSGTTKTSLQPLKQCKKMVQFYYQKEIEMLKLGSTLLQIWQIFVCTNQPMKNSTHSAKVTEICARKLERIWQVDHQLCLRENLFWTKPLSGIQQISANQSLELMRARFTPNQCVRICQQTCTQDGNLIPICNN